MQQRRQARELALQVLFQTEFAPQISYSEFLEVFETNQPRDVIEYADLLIKGVESHKSEIDTTIQAASQHWKLDRMALVDRNTLRLAIYEMKYATEKIKPSIAINEAVEVAKKYSTPESGSFVNGILDQVAKCL